MYGLTVTVEEQVVGNQGDQVIIPCTFEPLGEFTNYHMVRSEVDLGGQGYVMMVTIGMTTFKQEISKWEFRWYVSVA